MSACICVSLEKPEAEIHRKWICIFAWLKCRERCLVRCRKWCRYSSRDEIRSIHMSRPLLFGHASPHSDRSTACGVLYLNTPCWHLSVLLLSARSTILLLRVDRYVSSHTPEQTTVYHERCRSSDQLRQKIRARHSAASRSSLAAGSWADPIPTTDHVFWHSGVFMVLRRHTWPTVFIAPSIFDVAGRQRLRSSDVTMNWWRHSFSAL